MAKEEIWKLRANEKRKIDRQYISAKHNIIKFSEQVDTGFKAIRILDKIKEKLPWLNTEELLKNEI